MKKFGPPEELAGTLFFANNYEANPKSAINGFPEEDSKTFSGLRSA